MKRRTWGDAYDDQMIIEALNAQIHGNKRDLDHMTANRDHWWEQFKQAYAQIEELKGYVGRLEEQRDNYWGEIERLLAENEELKAQCST